MQENKLLMARRLTHFLNAIDGAFCHILVDFGPGLAICKGLRARGLWCTRQVETE
jgi:hypothetical protein